MKKRVLKNKKCACATKSTIKIEKYNKLILLRVIFFFNELIRGCSLEYSLAHLQKNILLLFIKIVIELIFNM